jgi:hypothetical protein
MPKRKYTNFWQTTCTAYLMRGSRTCRKFDLQTFMHLSNLYIFNSISKLIDLLKREKDSEKKIVSGLDLSGAGLAHRILALTARCARERRHQTARQVGPASQRPGGPKRYGGRQAIRSKPDRWSTIISYLWPGGTEGRNPRVARRVRRLV